MKETLFFKNRELNDAYKAARNVFYANQTKLNNVSREIKQVEQFIKESDIIIDRFSYEFYFEPSINDPDYSESLVWTRCNNQKRLCYVETCWYQKSHPIKTKPRPLIECAASIRLKSHKYLPQFLNALKDEVKKQLEAEEN